ncbi:MAG: hypothetical protein OXD01_10420 [Gammaproteobacteria bacterium]|nr:hypothetical protein [Gammaproteobacteria bacterium]
MMTARVTHYFFLLLFLDMFVLFSESVAADGWRWHSGLDGWIYPDRGYNSWDINNWNHRGWSHQGWNRRNRGYQGRG